MAGDLGAVGLEALVPVVERLGVVQAQELEVRHPQALLLDRLEHLRQRRRVGAREDVLAEPGAGRAGRAHVADGVQQHHPVVLEQIVDLGEELAVVADADVLEHADRDDAVVAVVVLAVVAQFEAHAVRQPGPARLLGRQRVLLARQRDAGDAHVLHRRQVQRQITPAAADVEHLQAGLQVELGGDQPQLVLLGDFQAVVVVEEVGARILHALVEEQRVEVVAEIVVMGDVLARLADRVGLLDALAAPCEMRRSTFCSG